MDLSDKLSEIATFKVEDRIRLVQAIWDGIAAEERQPPLTPAQVRELDRRLADHQAHPDDVVPWETVQSEARARLQP